MPVYQYEGQHFDLPEGLSNEQAIAKIEAHLGKAPTVSEVQRGRPTMANDPRRVDQASPVTDSSLLSQGYSVLKGAIVDPLLGTTQLIAQRQTPLATTANLLSKYLTGSSSKEATQKIINKEQQAYEATRKAAGREGIDVPLLGGAILSPVNKLTGGAGVVGTGALQGAIQPVAGAPEDYLTTKTMQVGVGALIGPLLESGVKLSGAALERLKGLTESGRTQAVKDYLVEIIGPENIGKVTKALQSAQEIVPGSKPTAAQALTETPEGMFVSAAEKQVAKTSIPMQQQYTAQEAARQAELSKISGTVAQQEAQAQSRKELFGKYAQPALDANDTVRLAYNNIEKTVMSNVPTLIKSAEELQAGQQEAQKAIMMGQGPIPKVASIAETFTTSAKQKAEQLKAYQKETLASTGIFPLEVNNLVSKLDKAIKGAVSDESKKVLQGVRDDLINKADNNGLLSSADLYENVRKVMNQNINRYLNQGQQAFQGGIPQQAAATGENVKKLIDAELNKSSNGLWSKYLQEYTQHSQKLDRMAVGQALKEKLGVPLENVERAGSFAQAVQDSAALIKKSTGQPRYTKVEQLLSSEEMGSVNKVLADLRRQELAASQGSSVRAVGFTEEAPLQGVNLLSRPITLAKEVLQALTRGTKAQFNTKMAELLSDPQALAVFLQSGPISGQRKLAEAINKRLDPSTQSALIQAVGVQGLTKELGQNPQ